MDVEIIVAGKPRKKKVLDEFIFDTSRCMFCALCQEACPTSCLELTQDFELATYSRAGFVWNREMLEQGTRDGEVRKLTNCRLPIADCRLACSQSRSLPPATP